MNYREPGAVDAIREFGPVDRVVEVALVDNWALDLAVAAPRATVVPPATDGRDLVLSLREAIRAGIDLRCFLSTPTGAPSWSERRSRWPMRLSTGH